MVYLVGISICFYSGRVYKYPQGHPMISTLNAHALNLNAI